MRHFKIWRVGWERPVRFRPLFGASAERSQSTGAAMAAEVGSRERGRPRPRGGGPRAAELLPVVVWGWRGGGRSGGGVKTAGMVGREKELSIHFVPGSCRLVEVSGTGGGLLWEPGRRGVHAASGDSGGLLGAAHPIRSLGPETLQRRLPSRGVAGGAPRFVYLCAQQPVTVSSPVRCSRKLRGRGFIFEFSVYPPGDQEAGLAIILSFDSSSFVCIT